MALVLLAISAGCGTSGLSFVEDDRVEIVRPGDRDQVRVPVTVTWTARDLDIGPGRGSFGVLLDRAPQRPGKTLSWLFRGDDSCRGATGRQLCASDGFLASRQVFRTTEPTITFERIPRLSGNDRQRQFHEATVVLLDREGRRVGEAAWSVQFEVPKAG